MAQTKKNRKYYSKNIKERFLDEIYSDDKTKQTNSYIFYKTAERMENHLGKDIYEFTEDEMESLLHSLEARSFQSISRYVSTISKYLDWSIDEEMVYDNMNILKQYKFVGQELSKYVHKIAVNKKYISEEELDEILDVLSINAQDDAIFVLLWEGVKGKGLSELVNLKVSDIDGNILNLTDADGSKRKLQVSDKTIEVIDDAIEQEEYLAYSDNAIAKARKLIKTDYVLRKSNKKTKDATSAQTIIQRINRLGVRQDNPFLTAEGIWWSGMINLARKIKEEKGLLENNDFENIMIKFNCLTNSKHKYSYIHKVKAIIEENL